MKKLVVCMGLAGTLGCESGLGVGGPAEEGRAQDPSSEGPQRGAGADREYGASLLVPGSRSGLPPGGSRSPGVTFDGAVEDCANLWDDDADGLVDCQDPDCAGSCSVGAGATGGGCLVAADCSAAPGNAPACLDEAYFGFVGGYCTQLCAIGTPGSCGGDGACLEVGLGATGICFDGCVDTGDCASGACVSAAIIDPYQPDVDVCYPWETNCGDSLDGDGDGFVDCDDWDCNGSAECIAGTCASGVDFPEVVLVPVDGAPDTYALAGSCTGATGLEQIFVFTPPESAVYLATVASSDDYGVYVLDGCGAGSVELGCAEQHAAGQDESVVFNGEIAHAVYIVVDGATGDDQGAFTLLVTVE